MQSNLGDILHQEQIKELISKIVQIDIKDYVSAMWLKQDQNLQKLNMQLHVNAIMKNDQYILQECVTADKFKILIYDLIMTATWKEKVLPLIKEQSAALNSLKIYLAIYHEAVICNILQVLMFHRTAIDESGEFLIEIIDYCYRKISRQVAHSIKKRKTEREELKTNLVRTDEQKKQEKINNIMKRTPIDDLNNQIEQIEFSLFIMSISILRYITDYLKHLEIGIIHHILVQCNIYSLLVPLIEQRPWIRINEKGDREIFENSKWNVVHISEYGKLPKTQAQVWITLYNMFMDPECRKKYELNDERKNTLLRLRKYLNEVLLDQIPNLSFMLRSLQQLSLMSVPTHLTINPFVIQQIPIIATNICKNKDWRGIALSQKQKLQQSMDQTQKNHVKQLADLYTNSNIQGLIEGFKCKKCNKDAFKRCSKCKNIWYCSKQCQISDWPDHKTMCIKRAFDIKKAQEQRNLQKQADMKNLPKKPTIDQLD